MMRLAVAGILALILGVTLAATLRVDTNPSGVFGEGAAPITALETEAGRQGAILIRAEDRDVRMEIARLARELVSHPMIERVSAGPAAADPKALDWLWQHRFRLAPPDRVDMTPEAMALRLSNAVDQLTRSEGLVLGDRLLRDPTGSFERVIEQFASFGSDLGNEGGFWRGRDGGLLMFVTFEDRHLDARELGILTTSLRGLADGRDASIHLAGPRFISTEVSAATERGASMAGGIAGCLLILWLVFALRDWRGFTAVLLPLVLGLGTATLCLQFLYGSVHVIALGFGGALAGLALDYPLHLAGHGRTGASRARRLIVIGAATTLTAFLSMTGAGLEVLTQTGLFVAIGLGVAACVSILLGTARSDTRRVPLDRLFWRLPGGRLTLAGLLCIGAGIALQTSTDINRPLFDLPDQVERDLVEVQRAAPMPATRHLLKVRGDTAQQVLEREALLIPVLDDALAADEIGGYRMAYSVLPSISRQQLDVPSPADLTEGFEQALRRAGLQPEYAEVLRDAYAEGLTSDLVRPAEFRAVPDLAPLLSGLSVQADGVEDTVLLFPPLDADALALRLAASTVEGVSLTDLAKAIWASVETLRATAATWLGIGAGFATIVLAVMLRQVSSVLRIVLTVGASLAITSAILTFVLGSLTVFQIVALTLVVGIGVDYALFLDPSVTRREQVVAARSVSLCAGSTLLAFVPMAWSDVRVMAEIGLTVSLGVLVVIGLSLGLMGTTFPSEERDATE